MNRRLVALASLTAVVFGAVAGSGGSATKDGRDGLSQVDHVVGIYEENHSLTTFTEAGRASTGSAELTSCTRFRSARPEPRTHV